MHQEPSLTCTELFHQLLNKVTLSELQLISSSSHHSNTQFPLKSKQGQVAPVCQVEPLLGEYETAGRFSFY